MLTRTQLNSKVKQFRNELIDDIKDCLVKNNNSIVFENKKIILKDDFYRVNDEVNLVKLVDEDGDAILFYSYNDRTMFDQTYVDLDLLSMDELFSLYQALI